MTPKVKELIDKFYYTLPNNGRITEGINSCENRWNEAKKCALIATKEKIELYNELNKLGLLKSNSFGFELIQQIEELEKL